MLYRFYIFLLYLPSILFAQKKIIHNTQQKISTGLAAACSIPTASSDLTINNVRTAMLNAGDMWWNLSSGKYEIPKGGGVHSIFAGALWIGGVDAGGQLKIAAQTYRQTGSDFYPGPLDTVNASTTSSACFKYDRIWNVNRYQVEEFIQRYNDPSYIIPADILEWPGNGNINNSEPKYLAPFFDKNADGNYNAKDGDYPGYDFSGNQNCQYHLLGDQTLWWAINDAGNIHGQSKGQPLGFDIYAQAFGYQTNDEINNATFYQYKVINRSVYRIDSSYFGIWVDTDLGDYSDDYIACDVKRGLGYSYNGDFDDNASSGGYGLNPPAIGCDFLGGPLADANDGVDNDRDSIMDEPGERIMMSNFIYYSNINNTPYGNPINATHYYNYLKSVWGDGTRHKYGGDGYISSGPPCKFFFPRNSDPYGWGTGGVPQPLWDEASSGHTPDDRRFLMSAGAFTMNPGQIQFITTGIIWGRDSVVIDSLFPGVAALQKANDKAQALFNNCFKMAPCYPPVATIYYTVKNHMVQFSDYGHGTTFHWDFGDGSTSAQKFSTHTYAASGTYRVCFKVSNACGKDSACVFVKVDDGLPPPWGFRLKRIEGNGSGENTLDWLPQYRDSALINNIVYRPVYDYLKGPVYVSVYDTTLLPRNKYILKFDGVDDYAKWKLYRVGYTDTVYADSSIGIGNLQKIPQWGMQIQARQPKPPGQAGSSNNGCLASSITFSDPTKKWLSGLVDTDVAGYENWIRSGTVLGTRFTRDYVGVDDKEDYEKVVDGTWAPYRLAAHTDPVASAPNPFNPAAFYTGAGHKSATMSRTLMSSLASVDVVFTSDKSKWTRCVVLEMSEDVLYSANSANAPTKARKMDYRRAASVDKNGSTATGPDNNDFATGMGWFPGYAINIETGERLNIAFGENSALPDENGNDMKWNPTSNKYDPAPYNLPWDTAGQAAGSPVFGGQHYIYIFGHNKERDPTPLLNTPNDTMTIPRYDKGKRMREMLGWDNGQPLDSKIRDVFRDAMWVTIPLLASGHQLLETDVTVKLRVAKPYKKGYSPAFWVDGLTTYYIDTASTPQNRNLPMYEFDAVFGIPVPLSVMTDLKDGSHSFFPNPLSSSATLVFENKRSESHELKIFDVSGKLLRDYKNLTGQSVIIDKGGLETGIYFYLLTAGTEKKAQGKFIVVKEE